MSSFPGTLLLLHHIKELETGKDRAILISETLHFFPSWNPGLRLILRIGALLSYKLPPTSLPVYPGRMTGYPHQGILKSVFWFKNPLQVWVTISYRTLEVTKCHNVQMSLAPGTRYSVCPREPQMVQEEVWVSLSQNQDWGPLRPDRIWMTSKIDQLEKGANVKTKGLHLSSWKEHFLVYQENMLELLSNRRHLKILILISLCSSETRNVTFHRRQKKKKKGRKTTPLWHIPNQ